LLWDYPKVQRAAIVLRAKNVPYGVTYIDRDNRPAWFLAISPHSKPLPKSFLEMRDRRAVYLLLRR
jgi:hypothetical protein